MKQYLFTRVIDGVRTAGSVTCRDQDDAIEWCARAGVLLDGEHVATISGIGAGLYARALVALHNIPWLGGAVLAVVIILLFGFVLSNGR